MFLAWIQSKKKWIFYGLNAAVEYYVMSMEKEKNHLCKSFILPKVESIKAIPIFTS